MKARTEACHVLKDIGGSPSIQTLQALAGLKNQAEVGRAASEAIKGIARRYPGEPEWKGILLYMKSPDGRRRREAVERVLAIHPVEAHRSEVARALETLTRDGDRGIREISARALATWGDDQTREFLIKRLSEPSLHPFRETLEAITQLGPVDERTADAILGTFHADRGFVVDLLSKVGPIGGETRSLRGFLRSRIGA